MAADGFNAESWSWLLSLPVLGVIFGFILRMRGNSKVEIEKVNARVDRVRDELEEHRIEVAKTRASNGYVAEVESRMTKILDRIEVKLDRVIENGKRP